MIHSGQFTHKVVPCQPWIGHRSGIVRRPKIDVLTTEPRRQRIGIVRTCRLSVQPRLKQSELAVESRPAISHRMHRCRCYDGRRLPIPFPSWRQMHDWRQGIGRPFISAARGQWRFRTKKNLGSRPPARARGCASN